jgi:hypothetical protein
MASISEYLTFDVDDEDDVFVVSSRWCRSWVGWTSIAMEAACRAGPDAVSDAILARRARCSVVRGAYVSYDVELELELELAAAADDDDDDD